MKNCSNLNRFEAHKGRREKAMNNITINTISKELFGDFTNSEIKSYEGVKELLPKDTKVTKIEPIQTLESASETITDENGKELVVEMYNPEKSMLGQDITNRAIVNDDKVTVDGITFTGNIGNAVKMFMQAELFDRYSKLRKGIALYEVFANGLAVGIFKDKKGKPIDNPEKAYNAFIKHMRINRTTAHRWKRFAEFSSNAVVDKNGKRHLVLIRPLLVVPEAVLYHAYNEGVEPMVLADYCSTQSILPRNVEEFSLTYNAYAEQKNLPKIATKQNGEAEEEQKQEEPKKEEPKKEEQKQEEQKQEEQKQEEQKPEEQKSFFTSPNRFTSGKAISIAKYTENLPVTLVMTDTEADIEKRLAEEAIQNGSVVHFSVMLTNKSERITHSSTIAEADMLTITTFQLDTVGSNEYTHVRTFVILVGKCTIWASEEALQKAQEEAETQEEPKPEAEEPKQEAEEQKPKIRRSRRQK